VSTVENRRPSFHVVFFRFPFIAFLIACVWPLLWATTCHGDSVLYQTGFEAAEGYNTNKDLAGQNGWMQDGAGGNGILAGYFPGKGQQAYVGFAESPDKQPWVFLFQPLNKRLSHVQFSVTVSIADSSNTNYDDFYWSVYNQQVDNLVTIDFDNYYQEIFYWLDGTNSRADSGIAFTNGVAYPLTMDMDFANNLWSAVFNGRTIATNQPLTTVNAPLDLGDIDAAWFTYDTNAPGNNYMVFDDYRVTATIPPPNLKLLGSLGGAPVLRLFGQTNEAFAIDASTNLSTWTPLKTNTTTGGYFDYLDSSAGNSRARFYRGRWVPN